MNAAQMWVYCNGKINSRSIIVFEYKDNRRRENPAEFLKNFFGYLICDGYAGHNAVSWVKRCGCLTHVRRKFVNLIPGNKKLHKTSAILYSLISTAQANGINAEKYLTELLPNPAGTIILPWKEKENNDT